MGSMIGSLGLGNSNSNTNGGGYGANNALACCDGVVDIFTLLGTIGSIVGGTIFLRQWIIDKVPMAVGRKRRYVSKSYNENMLAQIIEGKGANIILS